MTDASSARRVGPGPSPAALVEMTEKYGGVMSDRDESAALWLDIDAAVADLRGLVETTVASAFDRTVLPEASAVVLSNKLDALIEQLNDMKLVQHQAAQNATDFFTLVIDGALAHRKADVRFRPRGEPLSIDVRQTAMGASTIIDDDDVVTANRLHTSLF